MTSPAEVAVICELIEHLRPKLAIAIGTSFGPTSRKMAESLAGVGGKLITVDPVRRERMPGIIAGWPEPLRAVTEFRAVNSMALFSAIEAEENRAASRTPIGLAFVGGPNKLEYALFDIMEAADNLMPGGAVVVDDMEQDGPRLAALHFLRMNPAWKLFYRGDILTSRIAARDLLPPAHWGVLIAPPHTQITMNGRRFRAKLSSPGLISGLKLNVRDASGPVEMRVDFLHVVRPDDYPNSGKGQKLTKRVLSVRTTPGTHVLDVPFEEPVPPGRTDMNVSYVLGISALDEGGYVLLDGQQPYALQTDSALAGIASA